MDDRAVILVGPSIFVLFVGLGVIVNGLLFTVPKSSKALDPAPDDSAPPRLDDNTTSELEARAYSSCSSASVTEHTTRHLRGEALKTPPRG
jgi:hypothetical protein